jgi:hypothetical protein
MQMGRSPGSAGLAVELRDIRRGAFHAASNRVITSPQFRIAFVDNSKVNADVFVSRLVPLLQQRYGARIGRTVRKLAPKDELTPAGLDELATCDAVIQCFGDCSRATATITRASASSCSRDARIPLSRFSARTVRGLKHRRSRWFEQVGDPDHIGAADHPIILRISTSSWRGGLAYITFAIRADVVQLWSGYAAYCLARRLPKHIAGETRWIHLQAAPPFRQAIPPYCPSRRPRG